MHAITQDIQSCAIVKAIITIANSTELEVIAKGVETEEQRQYLFNNGCLLYKGYLFSHPIPLEEFTQLVINL